MKNKPRFLMTVVAFLVIGVVLCILISKAPYFLYQATKESFPLYQDETCWVCEAPRIVLYMDANYDELNHGFVYLENEKIDVTLLTDFKSATLATKDDRTSPASYYDLIGGPCRYTNSVLIIQVEDDALFDGRYERLIFEKTDSSVSPSHSFPNTD